MKCLSCKRSELHPDVMVVSWQMCQTCFEHKCETCRRSVEEPGTRCGSCVENEQATEKTPVHPIQIEDKPDRLTNTLVGNVMEYNITETKAALDTYFLRVIEQEREIAALEAGGTLCRTCYVVLPMVGECSMC